MTIDFKENRYFVGLRSFPATPRTTHTQLLSAGCRKHGQREFLDDVRAHRWHLTRPQRLTAAQRWFRRLSEPAWTSLQNAPRVPGITPASAGPSRFNPSPRRDARTSAAGATAGARPLGVDGTGKNL